MEDPKPPKQENLYKLVIVGDVGAGKTALLKRLAYDVFSPEYKRTIGVDHALFKCDLGYAQLWDVAGNERFGNATRDYYARTNAVVVVYDARRSLEVGFHSFPDRLLREPAGNRLLREPAGNRLLREPNHVVELPYLHLATQEQLASLARSAQKSIPSAASEVVRRLRFEETLSSAHTERRSLGRRARPQIRSPFERWLGFTFTKTPSINLKTHLF